MNTKKVIYFLLRLYDLPYILKSRLQKRLLWQCGENVRIGYNCQFSYPNISIGNNVHIGSKAAFISSISKISISDYTIFGPNVTIRGGDHRMDLIGKHISEISEEDKLSENDKDVIIQEGVWVGCNVTILKGVTVGKGAVVAAGSVVTKSVPPYTIVGGNPAKIIKTRFNDEQIIQHEEILRNRLLAGSKDKIELQ